MDDNYRFKNGVLKGCICSHLDPNGNPHPLELMAIQQYSKILIQYNNYICKHYNYDSL